MAPLDKEEIPLHSLTHWFEREKRSLPWRENLSPYRVWVAEVMLQQTQAQVVVPHFNRWMERFPDISTLAAAEEAEVIKFWEGLGYYARARALHAGARHLVEHCGAALPQTPKALQAIRGIGPYTSGAILSFAFHKRAAAIDGNVLRVASRLFCIEGVVDDPRVRREVCRRVEALLQGDEPWVVMEALIELGAQICRKKAACAACPLQECCKAYALGKVDLLPKKKKPPPVTTLQRDVYVVEHKGTYLIGQHGESGRFAGLWKFPYFERGTEPYFLQATQFSKALDRVTHTFTRYRAHLFPTVWKATNPFCMEGFTWIESKRLSALAFSSGDKKIVRQLEAHAYLTH